MKATLTFQSRDHAERFAKAWGRFSLRGHDMSSSAQDGSTSVTVHNVSEAEKKWIDAYVKPATT